MLRIGLFVATNILVLLVASIVFKLVGLDDWMAGQGAWMNPTVLLIFAAVFGMGGSFISLAISGNL